MSDNEESVKLPDGIDLKDAWRELKRRSSLRLDVVTEEKRKLLAGAEDTVALYGEPTQALAHLTTAQLFEAVRGKQREYGVDRRFDLHELDKHELVEQKRAAILKAAAAVVMLVQDTNIEPIDNENYRLRTETFGKKLKLSTTEPFWTQHVAGFASGVLVAEDIIATAGHCCRSVNELRRIRFVFGYRASNEFPEGQIHLKAEHIYEAEGFVGGPIDNFKDGIDWGLVRLKKKVKAQVDGIEVKPVLINRDQDGPKGALYVVGHPCGLPAKYSTDSRAAKKTKGGFKARIDTYGGNSGSPVFNLETHRLEGLVSVGRPDFVEVFETDAQGRQAWVLRSLIYPATTAHEMDEDGMGCTSVSQFAPLVPTKGEP